MNDNYEAVKWLKNNDTLKWTGYFSLKRNKKSSEQFRLWLNIQTFKTGDSLHITVSDLKTQSLPDINIPDPQKTPLENLYKKYLKKQSKGKRSILYEEVLGMSDNFIKELIRNLRLYIEK